MFCIHSLHSGFFIPCNVLWRKILSEFSSLIILFLSNQPYRHRYFYYLHHIFHFISFLFSFLFCYLLLTFLLEFLILKKFIDGERSITLYLFSLYISSTSLLNLFLNISTHYFYSFSPPPSHLSLSFGFTFLHFLSALFYLFVYISTARVGGCHHTRRTYSFPSPNPPSFVLQVTRSIC